MKGDIVSGVVWVSFEDCLGELIVFDCGIDGVVREVVLEVDRFIEGKDVEFVFFSCVVLIVYCGCWVWGGVDVMVFCDGGVLFVKIWVFIGVNGECVVIEVREVMWSVVLYGDFIVVLEVGVDVR